jgi:hypothetical protein
VKRVRPSIRVVGVEPVDADAMTRSLKAGRRIKLDHVGLFADGVAVKEVGRETFRLCRELVDEMVLADTDEMCAAIKDVFEDTRVVLEPAGALAIAGAKAWVEKHRLKGKTLIAVASGANTNFDRLRFIAEEAELGEHREALLAVTIPERPGSFRKFCALLGARNVTEFNYRIADSKEAHIFVGVAVQGRDETTRIVRSLRRNGLTTLDLSDNRHGQAAHRGTWWAGAPPSRRNDCCTASSFRSVRRADALSREHEERLEHQPVPLPQPGARLRACAGGDAGAEGRMNAVSQASAKLGLSVHRRNAQPLPTSCSCSRSCRRSSARRRNRRAKRACRRPCRARRETPAHPRRVGTRRAR